MDLEFSFFLTRMNAAYDPLGLSKLVKLNDTRVRIIAVIHSYAIVKVDLTNKRFNDIMNRV